MDHPLAYLLKLSQRKKIQLYKRYTLMKKKQLLRINFLNKCKIHKVFPNFITHNIKTSIHNKQSFKALQVCKLRWLNEEIKHAFWSRDHICLKIWILHKDLCSSLHPAIWDSIDYNNRSFIEQFS